MHPTFPVIMQFPSKSGSKLIRWEIPLLVAAAEIYGVVTDDFTADSNDKKNTIYLTGSFNEKYVDFNGKDKAEVKRAARKLLIMIG